jgi:hypothetical protein
MPGKHGRPSRARADSLTPAKPLARSDQLVVEELGDELLVYDVAANRAHSLGAPAAAVWRACDGETPASELPGRVDLDPDTVSRALEELRECSLLGGDPPLVSGGMTRREMTVKAAQVGATAAAVPLIWSVAGPIPEAAATPTIAECARYTDSSCTTCDTICGCCCCCQGSGTANHDPSCKVCFPAGLCNPTDFDCLGEGGAHCSTGPPPPDNCTPAGGAYVCKFNKAPAGAPDTAPCCQY